ncbi:RimK family protein [Luteibaculum oceani]|uniref:RimK family protein n=1 Tax=Luteibaculum oceani TaxID=1294296 RepID=A0A5C6VI55_9FLAO|nr:RimK family protein [Luteibaculum oceani]TXC85142.1 RimK family protein [Luteibaculum oceani]
MRKILVVENPAQWPINIEHCEIISAKEYLTNPEWSQVKNARVFNLSTEYRYQSKGYYVSLMAEARGHRPIPNIKNIQDLNTSGMIKIVSENLDELFQKSFKNLKSEDFILSIYFGKNLAKQYDKLSWELHRLFRSPFMRAKFTHNGKKWVIQSLKTIPFKEIPESHKDFVWEAANQYFKKSRFANQKENAFQFDLAILVNPDEKAPPSNKKALHKFIEAGEKQGLCVELIDKNDYARLLEFDALFIRETTAVNHYTYRFARRAQQEGMVVIDDPESILKCANKVYLAEFLKLHKIPTPKTIVVHHENKQDVLHQLNLPVVLKSPDSSFSQGVSKAKTEEEYREKIAKLLAHSDLVIAQEYLPSDFDWRIGVLDNEIIFACKYYMAKGHWQIYNWDSKNKQDVEGEFDSVPIDQIPAEVKKVALKSTQPIGNGLYGVDIKESNGKVVVIEVNDNPNVDHGVEDHLEGNVVYSKIIASIKRRIQAQIKP